MGRIVIDGQVFEGNSVSIINGVVTIDGVRQDGTVSGVVEVRIVEGTIGNLTCSSSVTCGDVTGSVDAGGSVHCKNVGGDVDAGGSVTCGRVSGSVDAGGSISISG